MKGGGKERGRREGRGTRWPSRDAPKEKPAKQWPAATGQECEQ